MPNLPLLIAFVTAQTPTAQPAPTAASLISRMFARYAGAKSFAGTIKTTQSARGLTVTTNTAITYERPAKIHVEQVQTGSDLKRTSTLVSDGTDWVYSKPKGLYGAAKYLKEPVVPTGLAARTIDDFYGVAGADMPDRSIALDLIVARSADLRHFRDELISFNDKGQTTISGRVVHQIVGKARDNQVMGDAADTSTLHGTKDFELDLTDEGDIVRYVVVQTFAVPQQKGAKPLPGTTPDSVVVTTTWDVTGTVGATVPADAFKLPSS